jgi:L-amino acid N-acyltransferase YncA
MSVEYVPVTAERWGDLDRLFGESAGEELGNPSRCWCMEWRLPNREMWKAGAGEVNRQGMREVVAKGPPPGIIAYVDEEPAGWCSVSPRPTLVGLEKVGGFGNFRGAEIWSVICFYVPETQRGKGLMRGLLEAAVRYAAENGARVVEGYPFSKEHADDGAAGTIEVFSEAGFEEVARMSEWQATMRIRV